MIRIFLISLIGIFLSAAGFDAVCHAQNRYKAIDRLALGVPADAEVNIQSLARYFNRDSLSNREKIRAVYRWMTDRIEYDIDAYHTRWPVSANANAVFFSKRALCEGFSSLFCRLSNQLGINCRKIVGYAKSFPSFGVDTLSDRNTHAWNAVYLEGEWWLTDLTFSLGDYNPSTKTFTHDFNDGYFLVSPEQFIYNHLPFDPDNQFLESPVSFERFTHLPSVSRYFFDFAIDLRNVPLEVINASRRFTLNIDKSEDIVIGVLLEPATDNLHHYYIQPNEVLDRIYRQGLNVKLDNSENRAVVETRLYETRPYVLYIFGRYKEQAYRDFKALAVVKIRNREAAPLDRNLLHRIQNR